MTRKMATATALALLTAACATPKQDTVQTSEGEVSTRLMRVDPTEQRETGSNALFVVRVQNDSAAPLTVRKVAIEVNFADDLAAAAAAEPDEPGEGEGEPEEGGGGDVGDDEVTVFEGNASPGQVVAAGTYADIKVPVELSYPEASATYVAFCKLGIAKLDVEGTVETSIGTLTLRDTGELPTPALPEPKAEEVQIASSNGGESGDLSMVLRVFNANVFAYKIRDWRYKLYVGGKLMREATVGVGERIGGNTAIQYDIAIPLNEQSFGPEVKRLLTGSSVPYRIEGQLRFLDVSLPTDISGEVNFTR